MRVTNNYMMKNVLRNMQYSLRNLEKYNEQLSTGKKFRFPSEDPVATMRSMQMKKVVTENDQYLNNTNQAATWLDLTDTSLKETNKILQRAKELTLYGSNGSLSDADRAVIAKEVEQLLEHTLQIANTSVGGRYIYAGHKTLTKPYPDASSPFQGDFNEMTLQIGDGTSLPYSIPGGIIFDDAINTLKNIADHLQTGDMASLRTDLDALENSTDIVLTNLAEVGARYNRVDLARNRFEDMGLHYAELLSKYMDVDISETVMNLKMQESVYRASLASNARIIQPTLLDFLR